MGSNIRRDVDMAPVIHPSEHFDDRRELGGVGDQIDVPPE